MLVFVCKFSNCLADTERAGQPPEPAADDIRFVCEPTGWLRLAEPSGSPFLVRIVMAPLLVSKDVTLSSKVRLNAFGRSSASQKVIPVIFWDVLE
jgi:hypothetical protein